MAHTWQVVALVAPAASPWYVPAAHGVHADAPTASKRGSNHLKHLKDFQGQNLALTVLHVPCSLDSGTWQVVALVAPEASSE